MIGKRFGIKVAGDKDRVSGNRIMRLDSEKKQLKYRKTIDLVVSVAALPANTSWDKTIEYYFNDDHAPLPFMPMYDYRVKGYNGRWGKPSYPGFQSYVPSKVDYPYFRRDQDITREAFKLRLVINNSNTFGDPVYDYPEHRVIVRLFLMYDELETV